jgi:hypothetical protein
MGQRNRLPAAAGTGTTAQGISCTKEKEYDYHGTEEHP